MPFSNSPVPFSMDNNITPMELQNGPNLMEDMEQALAAAAPASPHLSVAAAAPATDLSAVDAGPPAAPAADLSAVDADPAAAAAAQAADLAAAADPAAADRKRKAPAVPTNGTGAAPMEGQEGMSMMRKLSTMRKVRVCVCVCV